MTGMMIEWMVPPDSAGGEPQAAGSAGGETQAGGEQEPDEESGGGEQMQTG